jgi:hypothetical protein
MTTTKSKPQAEPQSGDRITITALDRRGKDVEIGYIQAQKIGDRPITWAGFVHKQGGRIELVASGNTEGDAHTAVAAYVEVTPSTLEATVHWFRGAHLATGTP